MPRPLYSSPIFEGLFDFCAKYTGGSLRGASMLNNQVNYLMNELLT